MNEGMENLKQIEELEEQTRILNNNKELLLSHQKVVDKLEQRISSLEKVLASHAKCIGRLAHDKENRNEQS